MSSTDSENQFIDVSVDWSDNDDPDKLFHDITTTTSPSVHLKTFNVNLNISHSSPPAVWDKLEQLYKEMPGWNGFFDGCPRWFGLNGQSIDASVEPSGLQFYAKLTSNQWDDWIALFKDRATALLGYQVGEPEEGFDFHHYSSTENQL